jgi:hypothetical protein
MSQFLIQYVRFEPQNWVFLSTLLVIGLFLMFHRFWSLRNLDILLVLSFTPGMMLVYEGRQKAFRIPKPEVVFTETQGSIAANGGADTHSRSETRPVTETAQMVSDQQSEVREGDSAWPPDKLRYWGFLWLIICAFLTVTRMLLDTTIVRRPLLDPNLTSGGMLFIGTSLLLYLMVNVATSSPVDQRRSSPEIGPGYVLLSALPQIATTPQQNANPSDNVELPRSGVRLSLARVLAIGANLTLVFCILAIGYWHFGNFKTGVGAVTFYLLLPYTAHMTGRVDHVVPSALLLLAILMYRQPFVAGLFLGCAAGVVYYPFSLLPLWCSFYWQRGVKRFAGGFAVAIFVLVIAMIILHPNNLTQDLGYMFGLKQVAMTGMDGIWGLGWYPIMRIPIIVVFVLLSLSFVVWPAQKNLATLLSCSSAIMAATQFWHGFGGGLYMAWFIPLALLTIFRPNLDYCIALEVVRPTRKKTGRKLTPPPLTESEASPTTN